MGAMTDAVADFDRLTGLKALADSLAKDIDGLDMADKDEDDEIAAIIVRNRKPASD